MTLGHTEYSRAQCPAIFYTPKIVTCSLDQIIYLSVYVFLWFQIFLSSWQTFGGSRIPVRVWQ